MEPWRAKDAHIGGWRLKMNPCRICRPLVANSQHVDEEQGPDQDPHSSDPHLTDADP